MDALPNNSVGSIGGRPKGGSAPRAAMTDDEIASAPYALSEKEMAVLMAYCGVNLKWKKSPNFTDAYLAVFPKASVAEANKQGSYIFQKLKRNGALDWFLEHYGISLRICADSIKEAMRAEIVETVVYADGSWDYKAKADSMTRFFAGRLGLRLHGSDRITQLQEPNEGAKTLAQLTAENAEGEE